MGILSISVEGFIREMWLYWRVGIYEKYDYVSEGGGGGVLVRLKWVIYCGIVKLVWGDLLLEV